MEFHTPDTGGDGGYFLNLSAPEAKARRTTRRAFWINVACFVATIFGLYLARASIEVPGDETLPRTGSERLWSALFLGAIVWLSSLPVSMSRRLRDAGQSSFGILLLVIPIFGWLILLDRLTRPSAKAPTDPLARAWHSRAKPGATPADLRALRAARSER